MEGAGELEAIVKMSGISKNYHSKEGEISAISHVDLTVAEGEFVSIVGPSGCGKSTLLSIIAGLIEPSGGLVSANGEIGYMFQRDHLFPWRTILSNALLGLEIQKKMSKANVAYAHELLEKYGLGDFKKHRPGELSGGMRQRAALIRTLATRPKILLLDEPFSALDYQTRLSVSDEIGGILAAEGVTAILVTHDIAESIALSDRVVVLSQRPCVVKNIHKIEIEKAAGSRRNSPKFPEYFDKIWKELKG
jgi:NitT/TauT family transport system ATP-binding protein